MQYLLSPFLVELFIMSSQCSLNVPRVLLLILQTSQEILTLSLRLDLILFHLQTKFIALFPCLSMLLVFGIEL
jgi:hypothetical protein